MTDSVRVLKTNISNTDIEYVSNSLSANKNLSVAICNSNTLVRCYNDEDLNDIINSFEIRCPDGFPVAKSINFLYKKEQKRVDGFNVFHKTIEKGLKTNLSHYFYGNTDEVVEKMIIKLREKYPNINILGYKCPEQNTYQVLASREHINEIINLKPDIVWVSLGFPKQEQLISIINENYQLSSNFVGVGAVFEWVAGTKLKAPEFIANLGLEWLLRLLQEPRRLFMRYFVDNTLFIIYFIKQYIRKK